MAVPAVDDIGLHTDKSISRKAEVAVSKGQQAMPGASPNGCALPAATTAGQRGMGYYLDDAAIDEMVEICTEGVCLVIDELGSLNYGDNVTNSGTAGKEGESIVAASGHFVNGRVVGKDATTVGQYVKVEVEKDNAIPLA